MLPWSYWRLFESARDRNKGRAATASAWIHRVRTPYRVFADHVLLGSSFRKGYAVLNPAELGRFSDTYNPTNKRHQVIVYLVKQKLVAVHSIGSGQPCVAEGNRQRRWSFSKPDHYLDVIRTLTRYV